MMVREEAGTMPVTDDTALLRARGRMALVLPGWDSFSVWGWDDREGCLFAQLWRDDDDGSAGPRIWITTLAGWPAFTAPEDLAEAIASATGCAVQAALLALAHQAPGEFGAYLRELAG
jgi:hypothetical protein